nr:hypothetical protein [Sphingomonas limnosediminicola]
MRLKFARIRMTYPVLQPSIHATAPEHALQGQPLLQADRPPRHMGTGCRNGPGKPIGICARFLSDPR